MHGHICTRSSLCVCMYNLYLCVCIVAVLSARSVAEPVSCQSYDSDPLALIASVGKEEERRLFPFNGHILLPFFPPFLFFFFFRFFPFPPPPPRACPSSGLAGAAVAADIPRLPSPAGSCSGRRPDQVPAVLDAGASRRTLKCKVLQPSHAH